VAEKSGKENPETLEVTSERYKINWIDFVDDYGEDGWGFGLSPFDDEVNNKK